MPSVLEALVPEVSNLAQSKVVAITSWRAAAGCSTAALRRPPTYCFGDRLNQVLSTELLTHSDLWQVRGDLLQGKPHRQISGKFGAICSRGKPDPTAAVTPGPLTLADEDAF